jgi:hypothetical protein
MKEAVMPILYHRTSAQAAKAILDGGFRDTKRHYGFDIEVEGVWLSDVPFDRGFNPPDVVTLAVTLDDADLVDREVITDGGTYREWLVPAALLNAKGNSRIVPLEEEDNL